MRASTAFWLLATLLLMALGFYLAGTPGARPIGTGLDALTGNPIAEFTTVYVTVMGGGMTVLAALRLLARGGAAAARSALVWVAVAALGAVAYDGRAELRTLYDLARGNLYPSVALTTAQGEARLMRGWDGHYRAEAEVNGIKTVMLVDTGASMVLLPYEIVRELGINPDTLDFSLPVTTANGRSTVAPVTISSIKVGPVAVFDVDGAVAQPGRLKTGLLGLTFIDQISETSFRGNRLYLKN